MPKAPPYPEAGNPYTDEMLRQLYARVEAVEAVAAIAPTPTPTDPTALTFSVDPLVPCRYTEAKITMNSLWDWWTAQGLTGPDGAEGPIPLVKLHAPAKVQIFNAWSSTEPLDSAVDVNSVASFDLRIGDLIDGLPLAEAINTSGSYASSGDMKNGQDDLAPERFLGLELVGIGDPGGQTLFEKDFDSDTIIYGAFWATWSDAIPTHWTNMDGHLSMRIGYTGSPPTFLVTAAQLASDEILFVRQPLTVVP